MINIVEMWTEEDEQHPAPCVHGNIVDGHACYCHNDDTPYRKCPIWRSYGEQESYWNKEECEWFEKEEVV